VTEGHWLNLASRTAPVRSMDPESGVDPTIGP